MSKVAFLDTFWTFFIHFIWSPGEKGHFLIIFLEAADDLKNLELMLVWPGPKRAIESIGSVAIHSRSNNVCKN